MKPGNNLITCRECGAIALKREAVEHGWINVLRNTWQCFFCSHRPNETLRIMSPWVEAVLVLFSISQHVVEKGGKND